jgi:hypothetical protein
MQTNVERKRRAALQSLGGRLKRAFGALLGNERVEASLSENRGKAEDDLRASNCPQGIDTSRPKACL